MVSCGGFRETTRWGPLLAAALFSIASSMGAVAPSGDVAAGSDYVSLSVPRRLVDTRPGATTFDGQDAGIGKRAAGSTLDVQVAGRAGVPVDAEAAVLTVTAVDPYDESFLTVHPTGTPRPNASHVNYNRVHNTANTVVARLGAGGKVSVYADSAVHLVVDVSGYLPAGTAAAVQSSLRLVDTRPGASTFDGQDAGIGQRAAGSTLDVQVAGRAGIPLNAEVAILTVTAVDPRDDAFLTVHATGTPLPIASDVNYTQWQNAANTIVARLGVDGRVSIYTEAATQLVVDVSGHFPASVYTPLPTPRRLADTRPGGATFDGQHAGAGGLIGGHSFQLPVAGRAGVPAEASTAVLTVAAVDPLLNGFMTVHPNGTSRPVASSVNFNVGENRANTVFARLGAGGDVCLFSDATTQLLVDVAGYLTGPPPPAAGPECPAPGNPRWGPPGKANGVDNFLSLADSASSGTGVVTINTTGREEPDASTTVFFSGDAVTWSQVALIDDVRLYSVVAGGPGFVAVGRDDSLSNPVPAVWTSADGHTWNASSIDNGSFPFGEIDDVDVTSSGLIAAGEAWDAGGQNHPTLWTSSDGFSWTVLTGDPLGTVSLDMKLWVAAGDAGFVVAGLTLPDHGFGHILMWRSSDGVSWQPTAENTPIPYGFMIPADLVASDDGFTLLVYELATVGPMAWFSPDGQRWDGTELPTRFLVGAFVHSLAADGSVLVVAGDDVAGDASIWLSSQPGAWIQVPPAALEGPGLDNGGAATALRFDGGWVVLGNGVDASDNSPAGIVWRTV